ncbi:MAG TPA: type II toxin-antitoxin system VapC family toxin [bacterium]|jgi:PIN domain nuclease of toxin-antitoxin system|nr:type II toxin-antitoxin system VapC family toxin [bacterium]
MGSPALMRLLLDTHVWIWNLGDPKRLSPGVSRLLGQNEIWLSSASVWETMVLGRSGKLGIGKGETPLAWIRRALRDSGVREASLTHEIALESECLALPHGDPADRFIVATANVLGLVLVTADRKILSAKACEVLEA